MENGSIVNGYLRHAETALRPSREEEPALVARARGGDRGATDRLVRQYIPFVVRSAMEFRGRGVPIEDLVHEGCLGVMKAITRFESGNGACFLTYAGYWVRKSILEAYSKQQRTVHVPRYHRERRRPSFREVRLDDPIDAAGTRTIGDGLADANVAPPGASLINREELARIRRELRALPHRQQVVLASRFGLHGEPAMTLMQVGHRLAISRERVRQIESEALARLRAAMRRDQYPSTGLRLAPSQT